MKKYLISVWLIFVFVLSNAGELCGDDTNENSEDTRSLQEREDDAGKWSDYALYLNMCANYCNSPARAAKTHILRDGKIQEEGYGIIIVESSNNGKVYAFSHKPEYLRTILNPKSKKSAVNASGIMGLLLAVRNEKLDVRKYVFDCVKEKVAELNGLEQNTTLVYVTPDIGEKGQKVELQKFCELYEKKYISGKSK